MSHERAALDADPMQEKRSLRLLIADDSPLLRGHLMDMISEVRGIRIVGQAESAPEAVELTRKLNPDVVILDIQMPGGSSFDALEAIKANDPIPIVIMFTNYPYPQYRRRCHELGADFFYDKSLESDALAETLRKLVMLLNLQPDRGEGVGGDTT